MTYKVIWNRGSRTHIEVLFKNEMAIVIKGRAWDHSNKDGWFFHGFGKNCFENYYNPKNFNYQDREIIILGFKEYSKQLNN